MLLSGSYECQGQPCSKHQENTEKSVINSQRPEKVPLGRHTSAIVKSSSNTVKRATREWEQHVQSSVITHCEMQLVLHGWT